MFLCARKGRFAQYVHHRGKTFVTKFFNILDCFPGVLADNELAGHLLDVGRNDLVENLAPQGTEHPGHPCPALEYGQHILLFTEVLTDVVSEHLAGGQRREGIHEAEHLDLELFVLHAPVHDLAHPGTLVKERWLFAGNSAEKFLAPSDNLLIER